MIGGTFIPLVGIWIFLLVHTGLAFNPSWGLTGLGILGHPHHQMTFQGVTTKFKEYFDVDEGDVSNSMDNARKEILAGTEIVDKHGDSEAEFGPAHCDDETLELCHDRLKSNLTIIRDFLNASDVATARDRLGRMLHTLQDFYSHSNWIELSLAAGQTIGSIDISINLADKWPLEKLVDPTKEQHSCQNCTYPGVTPAFEQNQIGFFDQVREWAVFTGDPMKTRNKSIVGVAMTIRRFGIKALEVVVGLLGLEIPAPVVTALDLIDDQLNTPPVCEANLIAPFSGSLLTSGYFGTKVEIHNTDKPAGKCSHGGPFDRNARGIEGISKDTSSPFWSPRSDLHQEAARLANKATLRYLDLLTTVVCDKTPAKDCVSLKALYGVGTSLSFVIDTTGSMGSVIAAVRDAAIRIVNDARTLPAKDSPSLYVLAPFNDPVVPPASKFTDPDQFISAILTLGAAGGGDCPELAMTGLQNAVAATPPGGKIFLWTDAGAKDVGIAESVGQAAASKSQTVTVFQFDGCPDPSGFNVVTHLTGGSLHSPLPYGDAGSTTGMADIEAKRDTKVFISIYYEKTLNALNPLRRRADNRTVTFELPVDPSVTFLGFTKNTSALVLQITRPDGSTLGSSDPGVTFLDFGEGSTETIDSPASGVWKITLTGDAAFSFSAFGTTSLIFSSFEFVENSGARHDGLFPVDIPPSPGAADILAMAAMQGTPFAKDSLTFEFRSLEGKVLETLDGMKSGSGADMDLPSNMFIGNVTVPRQSFNIYAKGKDADGKDFLRMLPGLLNLPSPPPGNGTNTTIPGNSTTSSTVRFANSTTPATSTAAPSTYPYSNSTLKGTLTSTSMQCLTCQPPPCTTDITSRTRTVIYFTSCPGPYGAPSSTLATTEILVPCYASCHSELPVVSPGCSKVPQPVGYPSATSVAAYPTGVTTTVEKVVTKTVEVVVTVTTSVAGGCSAHY